MHVSAIVLAAGKGSRLRIKASKPLFKINAKPLIAWCLQVFNRHARVKDIIVVANPGNLSGIRKIISKYKIGKARHLVLGGKERQDSVRRGLRAIDARTNLVLIHDAARPFIDARMVSLLISQAAKYGAVIPGVPVKATIKKVSRFVVEKTLDRRKLWEIQTPQAFKKEIILEAYAKSGNPGVTDDASLVEKAGFPVRLVRGSYLNIKVTTPEDLILAKTLALGAT